MPASSKISTVQNIPNIPGHFIIQSILLTVLLATMSSCVMPHARYDTDLLKAESYNITVNPPTVGITNNEDHLNNVYIPNLITYLEKKIEDSPTLSDTNGEPYEIDLHIKQYKIKPPISDKGLAGRGALTLIAVPADITLLLFALFGLLSGYGGEPPTSEGPVPGYGGGYCGSDGGTVMLPFTQALHWPRNESVMIEMTVRQGEVIIGTDKLLAYTRKSIKELNKEGKEKPDYDIERLLEYERTGQFYSTQKNIKKTFKNAEEKQEYEKIAKEQEMEIFLKRYCTVTTITNAALGGLIQNITRANQKEWKKKWKNSPKKKGVFKTPL